MSRIYDPLKRETSIDFDRLRETANQASADARGFGENVAVLQSCAGASNKDFRTIQLDIPPNSPLFPSELTHRAAAEQYRIIRTKIAHHRRKPRVIAVTSACSQDGKTVSSINMAASLASKSDSAVLLIDADLRRPRVAEALGIPISPGLSDILSGSATLESALVRTAQCPRLFVLPAGNSSMNPAELLDSQNWRALLLHLQTQFSHIIVDATPINTVADYELVELACDGVVLVVRPDHTDRRACAKMFEAVKKEKVIGVIVNCVKDWWLSRTPAYEYYQKLPTRTD